MHAETVLSASDLRAMWQELGEDESLDLPYELTEHGELVVSPRPTNRHQRLSAEIAFQLRQQLGGEAVVEAALLTPAGVRVPDVVWMPAERWQAGAATDLLEGPELVVEVLSPRNRKTEVQHKVRAYLDSGVQEVVLVSLAGAIEFHRADGVHAASALGVQLQLPRDLFV